MTIHEMQVKLEALADDLRITEERREALDLERRRHTVDHSLLLHRDSASADDLRRMIAHLEAAGMPDVATLKVDGSHRHTRMYARWSTDPDGCTDPRGEDEDAWPEPDEGPAPEPDEDPAPEPEQPAPFTFEVGDRVVRIADPKRHKTRGTVTGLDADNPTRTHVRWGMNTASVWRDASELAYATPSEPIDAPDLGEG